MGQKDSIEKLLEDYNDVFADIIDVLLFDGKEVIQEEDLVDVRTRSQYKADDALLHEQERDVAKLWKSRNVCIALIGIENQTQIDNDMPLRVIGYDGASYRSQILGKNEERYPVITLILYYGDKPWSGPKSLHESLNIPEGLRKYVNDYPIRIVNISYLTEEQVSEFQSDFQIIADYFVQKRVNHGEYIPGNQEFRHTDAVLKFLDIFTSDERFSEAAESARKNGEEVRNMCDVLDRVENRGLEKGLEKGLEEGLEKGRAEGELNKGIIVFRNMLKRGFSIAEAQAIAELTDDEVALAESQNK